jgi:hypothetical protein
MSELVAAGTAGGPPAGVIAPGEPAGSILIVDDTVDNLRLLSQTLTEHGYRVRAATSGPRRPSRPSISGCCNTWRATSS